MLQFFNDFLYDKDTFIVSMIILIAAAVMSITIKTIGDE